MSSIQETAELLHSNLYGKKNEDIVLDVIMKNNLQNRVAIAQYYRTTYETSLFDDIKSKIGKDFGYCAAQLFLSPLEFCIYHLKLGLKKGNECTMEMLTSKTTDELKIIEEVFNREITDPKKTLRAQIQNAYDKSIASIIITLFSTPRKSNPKPNKKECEACANQLSKIDPKQWIENQNMFKEIFIEKSPEELILIARYYLKIKGENMIDVIDKKIKGKALTLIRELLYNNIMPHELFAEKVYLAIRGLGTDEEVLSRVLVSRCELDMAAMRDIYQTKYKATMKEDIIGDTSGFYQKLCLYLSEK